MNRKLTVAVLLTGLTLGAVAIAQEATPPRAAAAAAARSYQGVVRPNKEVILTAPINGIMEEVLVQEGQRVKQGEVLARMDDAMQQVAVESAKLQAESDTEVQHETLVLEESRIMHERAEQAFRQQAASEWEVRRAKLQRDQAEASVSIAREKQQLARVNLQMEEERLARYRVNAPFDGHIIRIEAENGATLGQADKILSIAQLDPLEATLYLPVEMYGQLEVGQSATLVADHPVNGSLQARLKTIDPIIDTASRTFRTVFTIENPESRLPAGFMVRLEQAAR